MDIIKTNIDKWIHDWLAGIIYSNMEKMMVGINGQTRELGEMVTAQPSVWNSRIWDMVTGVADAVIFPIAAGILTYVMCIELIGWVNDKNSLHNTSDIVKQLIWYIIKLGIGLMLVMRSKDITIAIFDLGAWAISQTAGIQTDPAALGISLDNIKKSLDNAEIGELMNLTFMSMFGSVGIAAIGIVTRLIVTGRMIEIYIYCACGSAPYATLTNKAISGIGTNYIKNLLALAFQGFFMFLMLGIYTVLIEDTIVKVAGGGDALGLISEMLFIAFILCMMLMRSKAIAKSIFSAQ